MKRLRIILWYKYGISHWLGPYMFRRFKSGDVLWSLSLGGIEVRSQYIKIVKLDQWGLFGKWDFIVGERPKIDPSK